MPTEPTSTKLGLKAVLSKFKDSQKGLIFYHEYSMFTLNTKTSGLVKFYTLIQNNCFQSDSWIDVNRED